MVELIQYFQISGNPSPPPLIAPPPPRTVSSAGVFGAQEPARTLFSPPPTQDPLSPNTRERNFTRDQKVPPGISQRSNHIFPLVSSVFLWPSEARVVPSAAVKALIPPRRPFPPFPAPSPPLPAPPSPELSYPFAPPPGPPFAASLITLCPLPPAPLSPAPRPAAPRADVRTLGLRARRPGGSPAPRAGRRHRIRPIASPPLVLGRCLFFGRETLPPPPPPGQLALGRDGWNGPFPFGAIGQGGGGGCSPKYCEVLGCQAIRFSKTDHSVFESNN